MEFNLLYFLIFSFTEIFPKDRTMPLQAGFQILGLVVTLFIALVTGAATGNTDEGLFGDIHIYQISQIQ